MTPAHIPATGWSLHEYPCSRRLSFRSRDRCPRPALGAEARRNAQLQGREVLRHRESRQERLRLTGNNSCGGTSKRDGDKKAWIFVPEGYCERIVGGSKTAQ
jgi:hypothetical protein